MIRPSPLRAAVALLLLPLSVCTSGDLEETVADRVEVAPETSSEESASSDASPISEDAVHEIPAPPPR